jgi:hypothetical protein
VASGRAAPTAPARGRQPGAAGCCAAARGIGEEGGYHATAGVIGEEAGGQTRRELVCTWV